MTEPPSAWVLVPREPTEAMVEAAWQWTRNGTSEQRMLSQLGSPRAVNDHKARERYRAMLAAAPPAPDWSEANVERAARAYHEFFYGTVRSAPAAFAEAHMPQRVLAMRAALSALNHVPGVGNMVGAAVVQAEADGDQT